MKGKRKAVFFLAAAAVLAAAGTVAGGLVAARAGWQPPRWLLAGLGLGKGQAAAKELFCREHGVPERLCILCHPELKSTLLMCREHGVPEEICTLCHPEARQKLGLTLICKEHGLPEHFCPRCNPALAAGEVQSDWCPRHGVPRSLCIRCEPALARRVPMCAEHGLPEALCTICRPELARNFTVCRRHELPASLCPDPACQAESRRAADADQVTSCSLPVVRLAGPNIAAKAGIESVAAQPSKVVLTVTASGEVGYDETRFARVRSRVSGILREARANPGDRVEAGQVLAVVDSAELGQAKADYLAALPSVQLWQQSLERRQQLSREGVIAARQALEARTELQKAQAEVLRASQRLRNLGLDDGQLALLEQEREEDRSRMPITAPLEGVVVSRRAVVGEAVDAASELFTVADLSRMWIHLDVFEKDLRQVRVGQQVIFRVSGLAPAEFPGRVGWIDPQMNDRTRTIRVRAEVENRDGLLRVNMFGRGEIQAGEPRAAWLVPRESVQWEGRSFVVFVEKAADRFEPRRVLTGRYSGPIMELPWADLRPGEQVVTTGSFLLKTEIQKGSIGAGCCGD